MLSFWLWFCLAVVLLLAFLGMEAGNQAERSSGEFSGTYRAIGCSSFGCGGLLIATLIALLWWLKS